MIFLLDDYVAFECKESSHLKWVHLGDKSFLFYKIDAKAKHTETNLFTCARINLHLFYYIL